MRLSLAAAILAHVSGAPGGTALADTAPKRGGTLEFAVDAEPPNYDCHANVSFAVLHPIAPHYSTLLKFDTANYPQVEGDLAESWTVSPDKLTYTFKLRPNVLFHDGSRLTSEDVKASWERIARPLSRSDFGAAGQLFRDRRDRYARSADRRVPPEVAGGCDAAELRLGVELHLQRGKAQTRIRSTR